MRIFFEHKNKRQLKKKGLVSEDIGTVFEFGDVFCFTDFLSVFFYLGLGVGLGLRLGSGVVLGLGLGLGVSVRAR